jgi:nitroreductase
MPMASRGKSSGKGAAQARAAGSELPSTRSVLRPIELPTPRPDFGASLAKALWARCSTREFDASHKIPPGVLSELLWCGYGVNRPATADRTAPSWRHALETEIFAAMADGVWRYDPVAHRLLPHLARDIRAETGVQEFVGTAPLDLIYVTDADHLGDMTEIERHRVASADTGFIGQNVYLYCAAEGLATVFRGSLDTNRLARTLGLRPTQFVTFCQTVGYKKV